MGQRVGNTFLPAVNKSCLQQRQEYQAGRTEKVAPKLPEQTFETHETKTDSAVIKSDHLGCFRVIFNVFPVCVHVFPVVSEGF